MMNGYLTNVLPNPFPVYFGVGSLNVHVLHSPGQTIAVHTQLPHAQTQRLHSTWVSAPSSYVSSSKAHSAWVTIKTNSYKHTCIVFLHTGTSVCVCVCVECDATLGFSALQCIFAFSACLWTLTYICYFCSVDLLLGSCVIYCKTAFILTQTVQDEETWILWNTPVNVLYTLFLLTIRWITGVMEQPQTKTAWECMEAQLEAHFSLVDWSLVLGSWETHQSSVSSLRSHQRARWGRQHTGSWGKIIIIDFLCVAFN